MPLAPTRLALCLAVALALPACGEADDAAPTTDELEARAADMQTPTDAAPRPLGLEPTPDAVGSEPDDDAESPRSPTPAISPDPTPAAPDPSAPTPAVPPSPAPQPTPPSQPAADETTAEAQAAALWGAFRQAVAARDGRAIETLIADPVQLNGQMVPHAEFAEMTPGGSVSDFITTFEGELSTTDALSPAASGGYQALATARAEGTESALVFRLAPDADGTWRIVAIDLAG